MPSLDLGVLDTVIAVVVVILLLSMVVQSVQTFIKKLLKFKSRQIQKSLSRLFDYVGASAPNANPATAEKVMAHFQSLGRTTAMGRNAIESISKADLSKVVTAIEGASIVPDAMKTAVQEFSQSMKDAGDAVKALSAIRLDPESLALLTKVRSELAPVAAHLQALFQGDTVDPKVLVKDVMTFRDFDSASVLKMVADLVSQLDQAAAKDPQNPDLARAAAAANEVAAKLAAVHSRLAQLVAPLSERIASIDDWYDTVMLGFQERYARHMRTWAFIISAVLVVVLNADVFMIYKRLATSEVARARVISESQAIEARYAQQLATTTDPQTVQELKNQLTTDLDHAATFYPALGIEPLDIKWDGWKPIFPPIRPWQVIGWLVMAALLSLGAPFWHDTLESLFGLKNLLRDKSNTSKVEQASGAGLTRT